MLKEAGSYEAQRLAAIVALVVGAATVVLAIAVAVSEFPRGLGLLGCVVVAGAAAWYGVLRRGVARVAGLTVAALALAGAVALLVVGGPLLAELLVVAGLLVSLAAARAAAQRARGAAGRVGAAPAGALLQPEVGRREGGALRARRRGARARDRADRAEARRGPRDARPRGA